MESLPELHTAICSAYIKILIYKEIVELRQDDVSISFILNI